MQTRSRAAGKSWKPPLESRQNRSCFHVVWRKTALPLIALPSARGLEGMVAKDSDAPYEERRSSKWLKVKVHQEEEFVIGGFTAPAGERKHLGALLLGAYRGQDLIFVGKVGTGFSQQTLADLAKSFRPLIRSSAPFVNPPREKNVTWLEPRLVAQIAFQEWTADQKLRQPVFLGLRDDKNPSEFFCQKNSPRERDTTVLCDSCHAAALFGRRLEGCRDESRLRSGEIESSSALAVSGKNIATVIAAAIEASISQDTARQ